jgi:riboflavin kinase/FMN adenylyltransferase
MVTVLHTIESLSAIPGPVHLAAGVFDGLHRGHQKVIAAAVDGARTSGGSSVVLTFDPHPAAVLRPEATPAMLVTPQRRAQLIADLGVDALLLLPFTKEVAKCRARAFVEALSASCNPLNQIAVGWDWTFGYEREGDAQLLGALGNELNFQATVIDPVCHRNGKIISSTAIRSAIKEGNVVLASKLLGHPHSADGTVAQGRQLGREIGFPTANLPMEDVEILLPPNGVYAVQARTTTNRQVLNGVANLGVRPTIDNEDSLLLEVHFFDFDGDLYGKEIRVEFISRIRGEQRFDGLDALKFQIAEDTERAREMLLATESCNS